MLREPSDDRHLAGEERRIAHDGRAYTFQAFLDHYGESTGRVKWNAASDDGFLAGDDVPWGHYIARHPQWQEIVGSGSTGDPNRGRQRHLDYVFEISMVFDAKLWQADSDDYIFAVYIRLPVYLS